MKQHTLFYGSSYDRGLVHLLKLWPNIRSVFPEAELHICYGWNIFVAGFQDNPERLAWKDKVDEMMKQPGIVHHGRLGKEELKKVRESCGVWAYPTDFQEINCITALECQADGLVPVTMNYAALAETVGSGIKIDGDIWEESVQKTYLDALIKIMGLSESDYISESNRARGFAQDYSWEKVGESWDKELKK